MNYINNAAIHGAWDDRISDQNAWAFCFVILRCNMSYNMSYSSWSDGSKCYYWTVNTSIRYCKAGNGSVQRSKFCFGNLIQVVKQENITQNQIWALSTRLEGSQNNISPVFVCFPQDWVRLLISSVAMLSMFREQVNWTHRAWEGWEIICSQEKQSP